MARLAGPGLKSFSKFPGLEEQYQPSSQKLCLGQLQNGYCDVLARP